jgi:hypothetical protein
LAVLQCRAQADVSSAGSKWTCLLFRMTDRIRQQGSADTPAVSASFDHHRPFARNRYGPL